MSSLTKSASSTSSDEDAELRRGPWTVEEDTLLIHYIACHGEGRWNLLAKRSGLKRTGKSCRLRWLNYLKPDVKRGNLTPQEQLMILELHSKLGNRWSKIAQHLPGRTDNEIKNYWRTRVQKQARHLKIDSNSTAFQEVIRCFWMPRLIQKIQGSSASLDITFQNSANASPPPPVPAQGLVNKIETTHSLGYQQMNTSTEKCPSPSLSSSESMNISQAPQVSNYSSNAVHAMDNSDYNPFLGCNYNVNNIGYGLETFSPAPFSGTGDFKDLIGDYHTGENNWIVDDLWNMDELWQFMQLQERKT
ncbi:unnamed protein product [Ilex paraguariensis]|uniref:Uncharacterized protein n=1 Tax=Ilex paraguariensis TaxID=185542 RepID=A0ABC8TEK9_9AQUA